MVCKFDDKFRNLSRHRPPRYSTLLPSLTHRRPPRFSHLAAPPLHGPPPHRRRSICSPRRPCATLLYLRRPPCALPSPSSHQRANLRGPPLTGAGRPSPTGATPLRTTTDSARSPLPSGTAAPAPVLHRRRRPCTARPSYPPETLDLPPPTPPPLRGPPLPATATYAALPSPFSHQRRHPARPSSHR
ncbi:hypothetical protein GQ55_1G105100 [Panicum hallii var. hallii]|uniref:Uncharacterized protein n=1 Tax=Panicum hallii var. hallii TaxID=1504633 RepID=A0A2T7F4A8_9POAL|nr:hypothetical protein GQ55_1G105100 [Panicum hallii var. hallii]